jgi:CDP-diacylglycerol--glycerol-3-phosphate 3-phosphatidyltransferase
MSHFFKNLNIPNILTLTRILSIPAFVLFFYLPWELGHFFAAFIFFCAAITDWFDGYLARSLKQTTRFGAFLDPVADKLIVAVALVLVVGEFGAAYVALPAAVIVGREIVISALREWMAEVGKRTSVAVNRVAKIKTVVQMISLILLLIYSQGENSIYQFLGVFLLYAAAMLTLWSMIMYLKAAWIDLTLSQENE